MNSSFLDQLKPLIQELFAVDSVWSIVFRFVIWAVIGITIIASVDAVRPEQQSRNLKSNLGLFLLVLVLGGVMIYLLFGFVPGITQ